MTMSSAGESRLKTWGRPIGWVIAGALVGQLAVCAVSVIGKPQPNVRVEIAGEDVSRHMGAKVLIRNAYGQVEQTCNGACDDLMVEDTSSDNLYSLRIVDAKGECILCDKGDYVTNGMLTDWKVSGGDKLSLTRGPP